MIVLDMKIVDIDLADFLVGHIMTKVSCDWPAGRCTRL